MGITAGQRWMLKYYVGFFTPVNKDEIIPDAVLKTLVYNESEGSVTPVGEFAVILKISSPELTRRNPIARGETSPGDPAITNLGAGESAKTLEPLVACIGFGKNFPPGPGETALRERDYVVEFNGNGALYNVNLTTNNTTHSPQKDLRFRVVLRSADAEAGGAESMTKLKEWIGEKAYSMVQATAVDIDPAKVVAFSVEDVFNNYVIQPIYYIEQLYGFFGVAELIDKSNPTFRRLMISIHFHDADVKDPLREQGEQRYIVTPGYDLTNSDDLYTVGFHQDTNGDQSRLEFYIGRDDNHREIATYDLDKNDRFYFKRGVDSGTTIAGIGCWPNESDQELSLHFTGAIKEIICDPWGVCTAC